MKSKLKLRIVPAVYAHDYLHVNPVRGFFVLDTAALEELLKVLPESVDGNERQVMELENVQKPNKHWLHSYKVVLSVFLVLNQPVVP